MKLELLNRREFFTAERARNDCWMFHNLVHFTRLYC
jgi:hypothetical protein